MTDIYIAGTAMTVFGRHRDRTVKDLASAALGEALREATAQVSDIGIAFYAGMTNGVLQGQHAIPGQVVLGPLGLEAIPVINVENACASGSTAVHLAVQSLRAGTADVALAIGAEKMNIADRTLAMSLFESGWDVTRVEENMKALQEISRDVDVPDGSSSPRPYSRFMDVYGALARWHMSTYGTTQRQIAAVSAKNHTHSVHNSASQFRQPFTIDQVLAAAPVTYPLTVPMCAPLSDGAAALIACTADGAARLGLNVKNLVTIEASVLRTATSRLIDDVDHHVGARAAQRAYEEAGIGPEAIDVAEVHDATAVGELIHAENLGLVPRGDAGRLAEAGDLSIGGSMPINTSGGLESKGHPLGATGIGQMHELAIQLLDRAAGRQVEGARHAIQENGGGFVGVEEAVVAVHILRGPRR